MGYYRTRGDSVEDAFTLSPLPYPVLLILILVLLLGGISWSSSYEAIVEAVEEQFSWALLALPILLIFLVRWLSSVENSHLFFLPSYDGRWSDRRPTSEGPPPWGVAMTVLLLIVMLVQLRQDFPHLDEIELLSLVKEPVSPPVITSNDIDQIISDIYLQQHPELDYRGYGQLAETPPFSPSVSPVDPTGPSAGPTAGPTGPTVGPSVGPSSGPTLLGPLRGPPGPTGPPLPTSAVTSPLGGSPA